MTLKLLKKVVMRKFECIEEIQQRLYKILETFSDFCEENKLTYFLAYGSCLGAVRHKGFIPWDDDVDVLVPRYDYEKIHNYARTGKTLGKYKFEFYDTEERYFYPFCKLVDTTTTMRERVFNPWPMGLFVDIFPLDYVPTVSLNNNVKIWKMNLNSILLNSTIWKARGDEFFLTKIVFNVGTIIPKLFSMPIRKICPKVIDELAIDINNDSKDEYMSDMEWTVGLKKVIYRSSDFFPPKELFFNGRAFKVPRNYVALLTQWYGDYMKLPPEENRIPHLEEAYYDD